MLYLLTSNLPKYKPFADLLARLQIALRVPEFELPELQDEDFLAVLGRKARLACEALGEPCLVDDRRAPASQTYSECVTPKGQSQGVCQAKCRGDHDGCTRNEECCQGLVCNVYDRCAPCAGQGKSCGEDKACCPELTCDQKSRTCKPRVK